MSTHPLVNKSSGGIVKIKIYDNNTLHDAKIVALKGLNFRQDYEALIRFLEMAIRKSPTDPIYSIKKICLKAKDKPVI